LIPLFTLKWPKYDGSIQEFRVCTHQSNGRNVDGVANGERRRRENYEKLKRGRQSWHEEGDEAMRGSSLSGRGRRRVKKGLS